jgi:hypothetical protein
MQQSATGDFPNLAAIYNKLLYHNGTIYTAGNLSETTGVNNNNVYAFNGVGYMLGANASALNADGLVWTLCADGTGNIYAAGAVDEDGVPGFDVTKWNGSTWTVLGGAASLAANSFIYSLCSDQANNIYAAGNFKNGQGAAARYYVARWNGTAWAELGGQGALGATAPIQAVVTDAGGNLYAAGWFTNSSGKCYVARWNGTAWSELGGLNALGANDGIETLHMDAAGNLYAAGRFTNAAGYRYVARWNGTAWAELGTGAGALNANSVIKTLTSDAAGNIYAAGTFTNNDIKFYVARWNGTAWSELGAGGGALNANSAILSLCTDGQNRIYAAGSFTNSAQNRYVARYSESENPDSVQVSVWNNLPPQITTNGGTLQMVAKVFPLLGSQLTYWTINPSSVATINTSGMVTALINGQVWVKATCLVDPSLSDSMMITISNQGINSIPRYTLAKGGRIFPNPAGSELFIELSPDYGEGNIYIYDSKGAAVWTQKMNGGKDKLDIRLLPQGIYTLQFAGPKRKWHAVFTRQE